MQPAFERELEKLPGVNFLVSDSFLWWTAESAAKFGIPRLVFFGMSNYASCLSKSVAENRLLLGPESDDDLITLPEFPWIRITRNDFESPFRDGDLGQQKTPISELVLNTLISSNLSYGFISDSFYELEPVFVDHWNQHIKQKIWCTGPFCLAKTPNFSQNEKASWIKWLDEKLIEGKAVLYVAFGSQAEVSNNQLKEIAIGLEESMVNFLWVTRKIGDSELGDAFEESVKGRGIIVKEWVDQMEILMHKSVEGFLSHCGWNSTIESICAGVPILAWPMMAEQPLNARMVVEEIKVGLRIETWNGSVRGFVKSEGLKKMVKELMEEERGKEVRDNVKKYAEMAKKAMEEGSGSSWKSLDMLIQEICSGN